MAWNKMLAVSGDIWSSVSGYSSIFRPDFKPIRKSGGEKTFLRSDCH
jgi:hypothetical protein